MKTTEFHKLVRENGWTLLRQTGSHVIYKKGSVIYPVPYHGAKELGTGLENTQARTRVAFFDKDGFFAVGEVREYESGSAIKPIRQF